MSNFHRIVNFFFQIYDHSIEVQCGLPPVPVDADVVGELVPGNTTAVSYQCTNNLVLDGPQTSTCDQVTGQWSELPRCVRPATSVPKITQMVNRANSFPGIRSILPIKKRTASSSDHLPRPLSQFSTKKDLGLSVPTNVEEVVGSAFPEIRNNNSFLSDKETRMILSNPLPGSFPDFTGGIRELAVPVNAEVVNRPTLSVISIIAIQLCALIYFN